MLGSGPLFLVGDGLVLEVELSAAEGNPARSYVNDRRITGEKTYTFVPEVFQLKELYTPSATSPGRTTIRGLIKRGPVTIARPVVARVKRLIYMTSEQGLGGPVVGNVPQFLLFGGTRELFAMRLGGPEELLSVRLRRGILTEKEAKLMRYGTRIAVTDRAGERAKAVAQLGPQSFKVEVEILEDLTPE